MVPFYDLYAGGPTYPLSSLGVRLRVQPNDTWTVLSGVFQDNPPGGPFNNDSQLRGTSRWGGNFNLNTGALFITELQYALNPSARLPGSYKLGFWYDTGPFPSQLYDTMGLSLANPASNGLARQIHHNFSLYAVMDQTIWHPNPKGAQQLGVFLRMMGAPGDRNLISFAVNGGFTFKAPLPGRDNDTLGLSFGLARVSVSVAKLDQQQAFYTGTFVPIRNNETVVELTYQAQVTGWWVLQPGCTICHQSWRRAAQPAATGKTHRERAGARAAVGRHILTRNRHSSTASSSASTASPRQHPHHSPPS